MINTGRKRPAVFWAAAAFLFISRSPLSAITFSSPAAPSAGDVGYFTKIAVDSVGGRHAVYGAATGAVRYSSASVPNGSVGAGD